MVGSINADLVFHLQRVPRAGETLAARGMATHPGGKVRGKGGQGMRVACLRRVGQQSTGVLIQQSGAHLACLMPCCCRLLPTCCRAATRLRRPRAWAAPPASWRSWAGTRRRTCEALLLLLLGLDALRHA